jgi:hypothetical protein
MEAHDHLKSKDALQGAGLFGVRAKRAERPDEIEELPYTKLELKKNGIAISNSEKAYGVCAGDAGMPLFARIGDARVHRRHRRWNVTLWKTRHGKIL